MNKKIVSTPKAPGAVGPYSQAVIIEEHNLIFVSGQIGMNPQTKEIVRGGTTEETKQALENMKNILEACGSGLDKVVKTTVFMKELDDFGLMNEAYSGFFKENPPARSTVEVEGLPKGAKIEIEAIALI